MKIGFTEAGVSVSAAGSQVGVGLAGIGYGSALKPLGGAAPHVRGNRVLYALPGVSESYANGPLGLEQSFTIAHAPVIAHRGGPLTLALALSGDAHPRLARGGRSVTLVRPGEAGLHYSGLSAIDARGHTLRSWISLGQGRLLLHVDAHGARFPVQIDPFFQQNDKPLVTRGDSVAVSANGDTALVGVPSIDGDAGEALVFTRSGGVWTQQATLMGAGESGHAEFGDAVALSSDGTTALVGGSGDNGETGAAWVFTRSGETWTQQGEKLTGAGELGQGEFGSSVALAAEGSVAMIGAPYDRNGENVQYGAAWVFTRSGETWTQQGGKLTSSEAERNGEFGDSVALSSNGSTALIGSPENEVPEEGKAFVFTSSGSTWTQQGEALTGGEALGESVALSADGSTALIGAPRSALGRGAAFVFKRSGSTWSEKGTRLTYKQAESQIAEFGASVALSADGSTALIGVNYFEEGQAAAVLYTNSGSTWQQGELLIPEVEVNEGMGVALSADGETALGSFGGEVYAFGFSDMVLVTGHASSITQTSATLNATVNPEGVEVTECKFEYGISLSLGSSVPCSTLPGAGDSPVAVSASVEGLKPSESYFYRVAVTEREGVTVHGASRPFSTTSPPGEAPTVSTQAASMVGQTSAVLNATVNPNGGMVSDCHFEYGRNESYGSDVPCSSLPGSGTSPVSVSATVSGLSPGVAYHYRIVATNNVSTTAGGDQRFETPVPTLPEVGRCVAQHSGKYKNSDCTKLSKGEGSGAYEWLPWPTPDSTLKRENEHSPMQFTSIGKSRLECVNAQLEGELTGSQSSSVSIVFGTCTQAHFYCQSEGAESGEIRTNPLQAHLGFVREGSKPEVGWDLVPASGPYLATFKCYETEMSLSGSVIGDVQKVDKRGFIHVKFTDSKGKQKPESFAGLPDDVLTETTPSGSEQVGLKMTTSFSFEPEVEIKAIP